jgi:hypothetical protein
MPDTDADVLETASGAAAAASTAGHNAEMTTDTAASEEDWEPTSLPWPNGDGDVNHDVQLIPSTEGPNGQPDPADAQVSI